MKLFIIKAARLSVVLLAGTLIFASCKKNNDSANPVVQKIDPGAAPGNEVITITGSGLANIRSIVFDKGNVPATFNPNFNTDNAVIFRVPDTANGGDQNIILTKTSGSEVKVPFKVIALATISDVSDYNFTPGATVTIKGNNLGDVSKVVLTGSTTEVSIASKSKKELVITMPNTNVNSTKLDITNASGMITTTQEFVNMNNTFQIFTEGYKNGFEDASWGVGKVSTTVAKSGTSSFQVTYAKGNWSANGVASWSTGVPFSPEYKYLSFWVKGASQEYTLYITGDQRAGGYGNSDQTAPIKVPATVWTYFKIPLSSLELWKKGSTFKQLGFWIKGPDTQDETFFFDDIILVK